MTNIFEKQEGQLTKSFLDAVSEDAWNHFLMHDFCEAHLLYREVPERGTFEYKEKEYPFITYACSVEKLDHILPAFVYMIDTFYKNISKKDLVVVRQKPRITQDSLDNGKFYLLFRAAVISND